MPFLYLLSLVLKITGLYRYRVTADATGTGSGSIGSTPSGISYNYPASNSGNAEFDHGSDVTLTATADPGSSVQWTSCPGSVGGNNSVATCTMNDLDGPKTAAATFTKLGGPDLAGNWETLKEQSFSFGKKKFYTVQGKLKVSNIGNRNSGSFKVAFFTSRDGTTLEKLVQTTTVSSLKKGASKILSFSNSAAQSLKGAWIIAVIDSANTVIETDESNNRAVGQVN